MVLRQVLFLLFFLSIDAYAIDILICGSPRGVDGGLLSVGKNLDTLMPEVQFHGSLEMSKIAEASQSATRCTSLLDGRDYYIKISGVKLGFHGTQEYGVFTYLGIGRVQGIYYGLRVGANAGIGGSAAVFGTNGGVATYTGMGMGGIVDITSARIEVVEYVKACLKQQCNEVKMPNLCTDCPLSGGLGPVSLGREKYQHNWMSFLLGEQKSEGYAIDNFWLYPRGDRGRDFRHPGGQTRLKFDLGKPGMPANIVRSKVFDGGMGFWMIDEYGRFVLYFHFQGKPYFAMAHGQKNSPYSKLRSTKIERLWYFFDSDFTIESNIFDQNGRRVGELDITD